MNTVKVHYLEDRARQDLALRMIRHEARTRTIRRCTGLSDDRIRRLYRSYAEAAGLLPLRRRRGKSPNQVAYFTRTTQLQFESSFLASLFAAFGLLRDRHTTLPPPTPLELGATFCDVYETHCQLLPVASLSFEHAWFLLQLLNRGEQLRTMRCRYCRSDYVHDVINLARRECPTCTRSQRPLQRPRRRRLASTPPAQAA